MTSIDHIKIADKLSALRDCVSLCQMACDGLDEESEARLISSELFKIATNIDVIICQLSPINVEDEVACAQRQFDRRVESIKETAEREANAEKALAELEAL